MQKNALKKLLSARYICSEILDVQRSVDRMVRESPVAAFRTYWVNTPKGMKPLAAVDLMAERSFEGSLTHDFGSENIFVVGEESLDSADLRQEKRICVLVDMIDGTDLLQRGFSNWCSAVVIFDPSGTPPKILASFVAIKGEAMYFANQHGAFKWPLRRRVTRGAVQLFVPRTKKTLKEASVCMYAQKGSRLLNLISLGRNSGLTPWLEDMVKKDKDLKSKINRGAEEVESSFRFYDLAGNPMMSRMLTGSVDIVFDLVGQAPHDVVPGAFIAIRGGASFCTPDGEPISELQLSNAIMQPGKSNLKYVLASSEPLLSEFISLLPPVRQRGLGT